MKKETFLQLMQVLRLIDKQGKFIDKVLAKIGYDVIQTDNKIEHQIIQALEKEFEDEENQWIQYYIYEINYGKTYSGVYLDDIEFPLKTDEDLWDILNNKEV